MVDVSDQELRKIREGLDKGHITEDEIPNQVKVLLRTQTRKDVGGELSGLVKSGEIPFQDVKALPGAEGLLQDARKPSLADRVAQFMIGDPEVPDAFTAGMEAQDRGLVQKTAYDEQVDVLSRAMQRAEKDPLFTIPKSFDDLKEMMLTGASNVTAFPEVAGPQIEAFAGGLSPEQIESETEKERRRFFLERTGQPVPPELGPDIGGNIQPVPLGETLPEQIFGFGVAERGFNFLGRRGVDVGLGVLQPFLDRLGQIVVDKKALDELPPITPEEVATSALIAPLLGGTFEAGIGGIGKGLKFAGKTAGKVAGKLPDASEGFDPNLRQAEIRTTGKVKEMASQARKETLLADFEPKTDRQRELVADYEQLEGILPKLTEKVDIDATKRHQGRVLQEILKEHLVNLRETPKIGESVKAPETKLPPDSKPAPPAKESPPLPPEKTGKSGTPPPGGFLKDPEGIGPELEADTTPPAENVSKAPRGKEARATTPEGTELQYRYVLLNPDEVKGSVDADFQPREVVEGAQPRDRERQSTIDQLTEMASETKFDPRRLGESSVISEGAPNIDALANVEAGHGRSALLAHIKKNKPKLWEKYRTWLTNNADRFGLTKEQIEQNPDLALYRQRVSKAETAKVAGESNVPTNLVRSASELARDDAKKLSREVLAQFKPNAEGDFIEGANRGFLTDFLGQFSASERASFMNKDGALSSEGKARIKRALFARAFDDLDVVQKIAEDTENPSKNITNAMLNVSHKFARLKEGISEGERHKDLDITGDITQALKKYEELRAGGADIDAYIKNEGKDLFEQIPELQKDLIEIFHQNRRSGKKITAILDEYARIADSDSLNPKQKGLLGETLPPRPEEVLDLAVRRATEDEPANLFAKEDKASSVKGFGSKSTEGDEAFVGGGDARDRGKFGSDGERKPSLKQRARKIRDKQKNDFQQVKTSVDEEPAYNAISESKVDKLIELQKSAGKKEFWEVEQPEVKAEEPPEPPPGDIKAPKNPPKPEEPKVDPENTMVRPPEHEQAMLEAKEALELGDAMGVNVAIMEQPEAVALVRAILDGQAPFVKKMDARLHGFFQYNKMGKALIALNKELFKKPGQAERTLLHEIGHMIDWMDDKYLISETPGGNIFARMLSIKTQMKLTFDEFMKNEQFKADMKKISWAWRPFDESKADAGFLAYRNDGAELYADYVSALFNNPVWTKQQSPDLFSLFFAGMRRKPEVFTAYTGLMHKIISGSAPEARHGWRVEGYKDGEQRMLANIERAKESPSARWERTAIDYYDFQYAVIKRRNDAKRLAKKLGVPFEEDPIHSLQKLLYEGSEQELFAHDHWNKVIKPLEEAGVTIDDFGIALEDFYTIEGKAKGQRQVIDPETGEPMFEIDKKGHKVPIMESYFEEIAQPFGMTKKTAQESLEYNYGKEGPDKYDLRKKVIEESARMFRTVRNEFVLDNPELHRMLKPETIDILRQQEAYVAFDVVRHMADNYGVGPSARIYERVGTVEAVGNPFVATILKDINIMHSVNLNRARRETAKFLRLYFPDQVQKVDYVFTGTASKPKAPADPNMALLEWLDSGGKVKRLYVPKNVLEAFDTRNARSNFVFHIISKGTIPLRDLFVNKNPGFMLFNAVRDYWTMANQLPGAKTNVFTIAKDWFNAVRPAYRSVFLDSIDNDLRPLFKEGGLIASELRETMTDPDVGLTKILHRAKISPKAWETQVRGPVGRFLDGLDNLNKAMERIPKIASYYHLKRTNPNLPFKETVQMIRTLAGSPAFLRRGRQYNAYNNIFLFSNAIKEGFRSVGEAGKTNPGSFGLKTFASAMLPKVLMYAGIVGFFGKEQKEWWNKVPEYDLTNYDIIPLGMDENDEPIYFRVPKSEFDRLAGGLFWKMLNITRDADERGVVDLLNYAGGQAPSANPFLKFLYQSAEFAMGRNPWDDFRNRQLIPDRIWDAQDASTVSYFVKSQWNNLGGSVFFKFDTSDDTRIKTDLQKILGVPIVQNTIGRFVRAPGGKGFEDKLRKIQSEERTKRARELNVVDEAVKKMLAGEKLSREDSLALAGEKNLKGRIKEALFKSSNDPSIRMMRKSIPKTVRMRMMKEILEDAKEE